MAPETVKRIVFIGSHLGYCMDRTPLGGGAMVGLQLLRHWPRDAGVTITALGAGPEAPVPGIEYVPLPRAGNGESLVSLSELEYARFARRFEAATTEWVLSNRARCDPANTCVLVNDIAEGPTLAPIAAAGYPVVSLWHVDVVDYFNKLYLRNFIRPERLTRLYERSRRLGGRWLIPDMLRLIFEKQSDTVRYSRRMVIPSRTMAGTIERCYADVAADAGELPGRMVVVPWGCWKEPCSPPRPEALEDLRRHFQIRPDTVVLMTLSRISPEKGLHLLLKALRRVEDDPDLTGRDICLLLCGEPAFMQGAAYMRRVSAEAAALKRVRVFFPGYLPSNEKGLYFRIAHLFVSPSIHESYGLNIVEAMQAGLPILSSDHYGVRDLMDPAFGRMVPYPSPARAPEGLAGALRELLRRPEALAAMGRAARDAAARMSFQTAADLVLKTALDAMGPA